MNGKKRSPGIKLAPLKKGKTIVSILWFKISIIPDIYMIYKLVADFVIIKIDSIFLFLGNGCKICSSYYLDILTRRFELV